MTVYEPQYYKTKVVICRKDKIRIKLRCPACELLKRNTKHSISFPRPQTLWAHIHQCQNFSLIAYPTKDVAVNALEEICLAKRSNASLENTMGFKLGMIV